MSMYKAIINMIVKQWIDENPDIVIYNTMEELEEMADAELKFICREADKTHGITEYRADGKVFRRAH